MIFLLVSKHAIWSQRDFAVGCESVMDSVDLSQDLGRRRRLRLRSNDPRRNPAIIKPNAATLVHWNIDSMHSGYMCSSYPRAAIIFALGNESIWIAYGPVTNTPILWIYQPQKAYGNASAASNVLGWLLVNPLERSSSRPTLNGHGHGHVLHHVRHGQGNTSHDRDLQTVHHRLDIHQSLLQRLLMFRRNCLMGRQ